VEKILYPGSIVIMGLSSRVEYGNVYSQAVRKKGYDHHRSLVFDTLPLATGWFIKGKKEKWK
jgi:hypothetical protein